VKRPHKTESHCALRDLAVNGLKMLSWHVVKSGHGAVDEDSERNYEPEIENSHFFIASTFI